MIRSLLRSRARRLAADERGITLVEITVVVFLFSLVSAVVLAMFVSVSHGSSENNKINQDTRSASNGMNELARMIRAATENPLQNPTVGVYPNDPAIIGDPGWTSARSVALYAYVNLDSSSETPVKVRFLVNAANQLVERKYSATGLTNNHWTFNSIPQADRILSDSVVPGSVLFTYLTANGDVIPVPANGIQDASTLLSIRSIQVTLAVQSAGSTWSAITLQNTVGMPNLGLSRPGTGS
jgi:type II secretory pathway component PulJ